MNTTGDFRVPFQSLILMTCAFRRPLRAIAFLKSTE